MTEQFNPNWRKVGRKKSERDPRLEGLHGAERQREYLRLWYLDNRERILLKGKLRLAQPEVKVRVKAWHQKWYLQNKERLLAKQNIYRQTPEFKARHRAWTIEWYRKNKAHKDAKNKEWQINNPDRYKEIIHARRMREANAEGSHTTTDWENLKRIFDFTCPKCLRREPEIKLTEDHKIPLSKGGSDYIDNIQPLCGSCNSSKRDKVWFAFLSINTQQYVSAIPSR